MRIRLKNSRNITLMQAIEKEYIKLDKEWILIDKKGDFEFQISTLLYDDNDKEIFDGDILRDSRGDEYAVTYRFGIFFAVKRVQSPSTSVNRFPLYLLQENGHIPAKIVEYIPAKMAE